MRTDLLRSATLLSITSAVCLSASAMAQITPRPQPPVAPAAPAAPTPRAAPRALAPLGDLDGPDWLLLEEARDDAEAASRNAASRIRNMRWDIDAISPLQSLDLDFAPMVASLASPSINLNLDFAPRASYSLSGSPRAPWASGDPADSLYRLARESLNSGDYRRAAQLFAQITRQYPTSQYRADATYWRAFSLYRIGDVADLHEALQILDSAKQAAPSVNARSGDGRVSSANLAPVATTGEYASARALAEADRANIVLLRSARSSNNESAILAMRIRSALAARGDAAAAAQIASAAGSSGTACDDEDAALRIEALNALVQMDPKNSEPAITKVLARRDSCSVPLRRGAIALAARNTDAQTTSLLISTARTDPSIEVQAEALLGLSRVADASATSALTEIATSSKNPALQRIAVRSLAAKNTPDARQALRGLMARADLPNDVRITALHYAGKDDLQVSDLTKIYDLSADRSTRAEVISLLGQRSEPAASDELVNIARTSTDPALSRRAIDALARKKDPRTTKLLMDILNK